MNKTTLFSLVMLCGISSFGFSQCINSTKFPLGDVTADNGGLEIQINSCSETDEYTVLVGLNTGDQYTFRITDNGTSQPEYITITDTSNNVIVHGTSPIVWTATMTDIRLHWSEDASCSSPSGLHTTTYQNDTNTPMPPANDDIVGAIALPIGNTACGTPTLATNVEATASEVGDPSIPAPTCANYQGGDVWFTVAVPSTGEVTVEMTFEPGSPFLDSGMSIYEGSPGSLTQVECDDDDTQDPHPDNGLFSRIDLSGRTSGETLYVRVWEFQNDAVGAFNICAWSPTTLSADGKEQLAFEAYPNPVTGNTLQLKAQSAISNISVYTVLGRNVMDVAPGVAQYELDVTSLQRGAYFVSVSAENTKETIKIIKQ